MAEVKTCEQYVLGRLQEMEELNDNLRDNLEAITKDYEECSRKLAMCRIIFTTFGKITTFKSSVNEELLHYFDMGNIDGWRTDEEKKYYDFLLSLTGLKEQDADEAYFKDKEREKENAIISD